MPQSGTHTRRRTLGAAAGRGAVAGLVGVAVMTAGEALEQRLTGRPASYVPGRTMCTLMGRPVSETDRPTVANHAMHWSTGAVVGALRGLWAVTGIRGPRATLAHTVVRLAFDQTMENSTGHGAPPSTWPASEQAVDAAHKSVYALVTGLVADSWIAPTLQSSRGRHSH
jgi:hypothetical protein